MNNYSIFKRKQKNAYYVQFYNPERGCYGNAISIHALARKLGDPPFFGKENKALSYNIAERAFQKGLGDAVLTKGINFVTYVEEFWSWDKSEYIKLKNKINPNSIGKDYVGNMYRYFQIHAKPLFSDKLKLRDVKKIHINRLLNALIAKAELSNASINMVMKSISVPLGEAKRLDLILSNPMEDYQNLSTKDEKQRGIPTKMEVEKLLYYMDRESNEGRMDRRLFLAVATAVYTGMRQGEIRALRTNSFEFPNAVSNEDQGIIVVKEAFAKEAKFKTTKGKKIRRTPAPKWLCKELLDYGKRNPHGQNLVFFSDRVPDVPVTSTFITQNYYKALEAIGIKKNERVRRNIDFHSLRHFFNTQMRGIVSEEELRAIIGHESEKMTERYTHESEEHLLEMGKKTKDIIRFNRK